MFEPVLAEMTPSIVVLVGGRMFSHSPGPKVIKLNYSLKLKIKRNGWLLVDT